MSSCIHTYTHTHTYKSYIHTITKIHVLACIKECVLTYKMSMMSLGIFLMYVCMYHVCTHVCMHACMNACMYECIYIRKINTCGWLLTTIGLWHMAIRIHIHLYSHMRTQIDIYTYSHNYLIACRQQRGDGIWK